MCRLLGNRFEPVQTCLAVDRPTSYGGWFSGKTLDSNQKDTGSNPGQVTETFLKLLINNDEICQCLPDLILSFVSACLLCMLLIVSDFLRLSATTCDL